MCVDTLIERTVENVRHSAKPSVVCARLSGSFVCFQGRALGLKFKVVLNLFLPMNPFSLLFFLVDPFIAIGHKNNHLRLFLPLTDGWTPSD